MSTILNGSFENAKAIVREKLATDNAWLVRGLLAIHAKQTDDEKRSHETRHDNDRGFNSADAPLMTSFVNQWNTRHWFSDKQMNRLRKTMRKYAGQLVRIAREKATIAA